ELCPVLHLLVLDSRTLRDHRAGIGQHHTQQHHPAQKFHSTSPSAPNPTLRCGRCIARSTAGSASCPASGHCSRRWLLLQRKGTSGKERIDNLCSAKICVPLSLGEIAHEESSTNRVHNPGAPGQMIEPSSASGRLVFRCL